MNDSTDPLLSPEPEGTDAVTDVPEDVQREVAELLADEVPTTTVITIGDLDNVDSFGDRTHDDVLVMPTSASATAHVDVEPVIATPPIGEVLVSFPSQQDVLVIGEDDAGVVVVHADEVDRVVIVDDDSPDPRFEERRRRNERMERLRKFRWLRFGGYATAAIVLVLAVLASPLFAVRSVTIEGATYASGATLDKAVSMLKGSSVFTVDTDAVRRRLMRDPWISDARVSTDFPSSALIEIDERTPVIWYAGVDTKARVLGVDGRVITVLDGWPTQYLQVTGGGPDLSAGSQADDIYRALAQLVSALPTELRSKVKEAGITAGQEVTLTLKSGTIVRFGQPVDLQNKLVAVVVLLRRQDPARMVAIDVSTGEATYQVR